jgi:head-tail adaptor
VRIPAGKFNRLVRFERPVPDTSLDGAGSGTWAAVAEARAELQDVLPSRGEQQSNGMTTASRPARLRVRWRPDLTADMRVLLIKRRGETVFIERTMQIVSGPAEIGHRDGLEFVVEEYRPAGNTA